LQSGQAIRRVDIDDYCLGEVTAGGTVLCTLGPKKEVLIEQAKARWRWSDEYCTSDRTDDLEWYYG